jgi:hypothetical protein
MTPEGTNKKEYPIFTKEFPNSKEGIGGALSHQKN